MELVSIIVPVYKAEKYLPTCIDSILAQTYENFEVILIDDGSPDTSGAICDKYTQEDSRIKVIHQENAGVSTARNAGINIATGDWILFIDSDDYIETEYISSLIKASKPNTLIIQGYKAVSSNHSISVKILKEMQYDRGNIAELFANPQFYEYGHPFGKLYNSYIIKQNHIRFNKKLSYAEDLIFLLNYILHIDCISYINGAYYNYTINTYSLSKQINPFENEYLLFKEFSLLNTALRKKFRFKKTKAALYNEALLLMRCIYSLFTEKIIFTDRNKIIKQLKKENKYLLINYYKPKTTVLMVYKVLLILNTSLFNYIVSKVKKI